MQCEDIQKQLNAFHDGELKGEARKKVSAHVAYCAICREALFELARVDAAGQKPLMEDPGQVYWQRLNQDIRRAVDKAAPGQGEKPLAGKSRVLPWRPEYVRWAGMAAVAVLVLFVGRQVLESDRAALDSIPNPLVIDGLTREDVSEAAAPPKGVLNEKREGQGTPDAVSLKESNKALTAEEEKVGAVSDAVVSSQEPAVKTMRMAESVSQPAPVYGVEEATAPSRPKAAAAGRAEDQPAPAADSLGLRIGHLEAQIMTQDDSLSIRKIRAEQARLHFQRAQLPRLIKAADEALQFYKVHGYWLQTHADSLYFRACKNELESRLPGKNEK